MKSTIQFAIKSCLGTVERVGFGRENQESYIRVNPLSTLIYRRVYSYGKSPWRKFK
jgi:hypothetical protein